jgi:hypothetical protein
MRTFTMRTLAVAGLLQYGESLTLATIAETSGGLTPAAFWASKCTAIPSETGYVTVTMGSAVDHFKPAAGHTFCEMLESNDKHLYWNAGPKVLEKGSDGSLFWNGQLGQPGWVTPVYGTNHLGGSAVDWAKQHIDGDARNYISYWGSPLGGHPSGCCSDDPTQETTPGSSGYGWGQSFTMEWHADPGAGNPYSSTNADGTVRAPTINGQPAPTPSCNTSPIAEQACTSGSGATTSGSCSAPSRSWGDFCCHDSTYTSSQHPDPSFAFATYNYDTAVSLSNVNIEQHTNGIDCIRAELDGKDAGISCVANQGNGGNAHFVEHSTSMLNGFDSSVTGYYLKLFVHKTSLINAFATYMMKPTVACAVPTEAACTPTPASTASVAATLAMERTTGSSASIQFLEDGVLRVAGATCLEATLCNTCGLGGASSTLASRLDVIAEQQAILIAQFATLQNKSAALEAKDVAMEAALSAISLTPGPPGADGAPGATGPAGSAANTDALKAKLCSVFAVHHHGMRSALGC